MTADELAAWLRAHGHDDVDQWGDEEVTSKLHGKPRRYVLANDARGGLVGNDYWRVIR